MDKETQEIRTEAKKLEGLIQNEGYQLAKAKLLSRVSEIIDIHNLDLSLPPEQLAIELKANRKASQIVLDWLRVDIEGTVAQAETNLQGFTLTETPWIIREQ